MYMNMSDMIYKALAATITATTTVQPLRIARRRTKTTIYTKTSSTTTRTTTTTATTVAAAATAATALAATSVSVTAKTIVAATTAAGIGVSWAAEQLYDEVDVFFATDYINDSWVTIPNGSISSNNNSNNYNSSSNSNSNITNDNTTSIIYGDINQLTLFNGNGSNHTDADAAAAAAAAAYEELTALIKMLALSIVLGLMILITIIGNVFVIAAIMLERNLQNVANYLVASLAVADLFVACLVMPLGAVYEISQGWILGPELCDIWTCCDVLCCTASILHLVAIASDRYWTVTNIDYTNFRTPRRVFIMILLVWLASVVVSLAPQFGWKDPEYMERINEQKCMVSQDVGYQIFATCSTFYVPLLVILVLYWKIYKIARKRIQRRRQRPHFNVSHANNTNHQTKSQRQKQKQLLKQQKKELLQQQKQQQLVEDQQQQLGGKTKRQKRLKILFGGSSCAAATPDITTAAATTTTTTTTAATTITTTAIAVTTTAITTTTTTTPVTAVTAATMAAETTTINTMTAGRNGVTISTTTTMEGVALTDKPLAALTAHSLGVNVGTGAEETEYSTSNFDSKSHGTEVTTISSDADEQQTPLSNTEIHTISHQVAVSTTKQQQKQPQQPQQDQAESMEVSLQVPQGISSEPNSGETLPNKLLTSIPNPLSKLAKRRQLLEARRERKAAQTLAIITGAFVVCWLPFFVMALLLPLCKSCDISPTVASIFLWLGYFNSTLNPMIYTVFNPEFRRAFQRIVYGRKTMPHAAASRKM